MRARTNITVFNLDNGLINSMFENRCAFFGICRVFVNRSRVNGLRWYENLDNVEIFPKDRDTSALKKYKLFPYCVLKNNGVVVARVLIGYDFYCSF